MATSAVMKGNSESSTKNFPISQAILSAKLDTDHVGDYVGHISDRGYPDHVCPINDCTEGRSSSAGDCYHIKGYFTGNHNSPNR